ncbi:hypothetical protein TRFO_28758 [Tritrichomonas foetus]|uniref:Uncharacterized protein n=1 Tax=Tritrichomonas foetus TaxID=1144522 RepID=A0A1J4JZJ5_9EUKA|nr:hypothetical protein TRFO_28758 [Tritrichomonas foetus]|eukprot:OHT03912.1 hypothetical protein TRFO_28758 [Tritrichomonas foetus]
MFSFIFPFLLLAADYPSLELDDTYHEVLLTNSSYSTFWVQPYPGHSAILAIHPSNLKINGFKSVARKSNDTPDFTPISSPAKVERLNGYVETRFTFTEENPLLFRMNCNETDCPIVINFVHTDPVYRTSAVLGAFSLFVCLFLLVFSWTIFCGACRATRKR